jgi:cobalt-zinc-cadmium efflux system membrane fusion protein
MTMVTPRSVAPVSLVLGLFTIGLPTFVACRRPERDTAARAGPATRVEPAPDAAVVQVEHPERFSVVRVQTRAVPNELHVNGVVAPDVTRTVHVMSLAGGKLVDLRAHLGDEVQRGQVLMVIHTPDLSKAIGDYRKALADQALADKALRRAQALWQARALAEKDLQQAENDARKAAVDVQTAGEQIRILGGDLDRLSPLVEVRAPIAGTIVEQNTTSGEAIKSVDNSPNLLTIADLSRVWVLCDVYENNLADVKIGDRADVRLNAYPERPLTGTVSDISRVLDPATRTAKVRIELENPDALLRPGMFATARFVSQAATTHAVAPASAVLRLQDRSWVFREDGPARFRRSEVQAGRVLPDGTQEILTGLAPGDPIVADALAFVNGASNGTAGG